MLRFTDLITNYTNRVYWAGVQVATLRTIILFGRVLIPSLVIAGELIEDNCNERPITPWVTLGVSIVVSLSTGWMETFSMSRQYQTYLLTRHQLDQEAWTFISLSGRYSKYKRHAHCWRRFAAQVEHVHSLGVENYAMMGQDNDVYETNPPDTRIDFTIPTSENGGSMTSHSDDDEIAGGYVIGVQHPRAASSIPMTGTLAFGANGGSTTYMSNPVIRRQNSGTEDDGAADDENSSGNMA
jgi:hypothetical protein